MVGFVQYDTEGKGPFHQRTPLFQKVILANYVHGREFQQSEKRPTRRFRGSDSGRD